MGTRQTVPIDLDWMQWPLLWLVLAAVFAFGIGSINIPLLNRLVAHGVQANATAVKLAPEIHGTVCYEYEVSGLKFEGQTQPWLPNPPLEQIKIGQSLVVYYDPLNPSRSILGAPQAMLNNEIIFVGLAATGGPTFIVLILISNLRKRRLRHV